MRHLTFQQLRIFEAIARNGSFTAAAEELFLTQPTVSMQIKKMTDAIGLQLFEQIGRQVYLTEAGRELLATSREIFNSLSRYEEAIANIKGIKEGALSITGVTTAEYFAPRVLGAFHQRYPGIKVSLKVANREMVLNRLAENRDDLYILGQPPKEMNVIITPFLENPLVVLAPKNHRLAGQKNIPLEAITKECFLMRESGSGTRIAFERLLNERGVTLKNIIELGSNEAVKQGIIGGLGVSVLSKYTLAYHGAIDELTLLDIEGFPLPHYWYVVFPAGKQLSIVAQEFLNFLLTEGKRTIKESLLGKHSL